MTLCKGGECVSKNGTMHDSFLTGAGGILVSVTCNLRKKEERKKTNWAENFLQNISRKLENNNFLF